MKRYSEQKLINAENLTGDTSKIYGDASDIRGYVTYLEGDVSNIYGDVSYIEGNVSNISGDVSSITGDVSNVSGFFGDFLERRDEYVYGDVSNIYGDVTNVKGDATGLSGNVEDLVEQGKLQRISRLRQKRSVIELKVGDRVEIIDISDEAKGMRGKVEKIFRDNNEAIVRIDEEYLPRLKKIYEGLPSYKNELELLFNMDGLKKISSLSLSREVRRKNMNRLGIVKRGDMIKRYTYSEWVEFFNYLDELEETGRIGAGRTGIEEVSTVSGELGIDRIDATGIILMWRKYFGKGIGSAEERAKRVVDRLQKIDKLGRDSSKLRSRLVKRGDIQEKYTYSEWVEFFNYLDELRLSGVTNMFGASPYVSKEFGVNNTDAREIVSSWMRYFGDGTDSVEERAKRVVGRLRRRSRERSELREGKSTKNLDMIIQSVMPKIPRGSMGYVMNLTDVNVTPDVIIDSLSVLQKYLSLEEIQEIEKYFIDEGILIKHCFSNKRKGKSMRKSMRGAGFEKRNGLVPYDPEYLGSIVRLPEGNRQYIDEINMSFEPLSSKEGSKRLRSKLRRSVQDTPTTPKPTTEAGEGKTWVWSPEQESWVAIDIQKEGRLRKLSNDSKHYIGEEYQGGIIFYLNPDGKSGLISAKEDLGNDDGATSDEAMDIARNYNGGGYTDWYLPSLDELELLYIQRDKVGGFADKWHDSYYWSSSDSRNNIYERCSLDFFNGFPFYNTDKLHLYRVRAIRKFTDNENTTEGSRLRGRKRLGLSKGHTEVEVSEIPLCDFCERAGKNVPAVYDARTMYGQWAYMCEECFKNKGIGLGLGKGQRLILKKSRKLEGGSRWRDSLTGEEGVYIVGSDEKSDKIVWDDGSEAPLYDGEATAYAMGLEKVENMKRNSDLLNIREEKGDKLNRRDVEVKKNDEDLEETWVNPYALDTLLLEGDLVSKVSKKEEVDKKMKFSWQIPGGVKDMAVCRVMKNFRKV